ncbi:hypothetical protein ACXWTF_12555 [Thiomicrolovo sp. ZZH C-3]
MLAAFAQEPASPDLVKKGTVVNAKLIAAADSERKALFEEIDKLKKEVAALKAGSLGAPKQLEASEPKGEIRGNSISAFDAERLYYTIKETDGYVNATGDLSTGREYNKHSLVLVEKRAKKRSRITGGTWIDNDAIAKFEFDKNKKGAYAFMGVFYKVQTYMANARQVPSAKTGEIRRVLWKNDIVMVQKTLESEGGTWGRLSDGLYMNIRLLKRVDFYE